MPETFLNNPLVNQVILPFVLVFVLIFAILDRTKILGEGKRQINALVSLAIALIFVTFSRAVGIVVGLMPFLAVVVVIILVFFILYGFIATDNEGLKIPLGIKIAGGIVVLLALIVAVLVVTGVWGDVMSIFTNPGSSSIATTAVILVIVAGMVAVVLTTGKKS